MVDHGRFTSRRHFARVAEGEDREESTQRYVTKVLTEGLPPQIERVGTWADALELYGDERQHFLDLAAIAHLPAEVQPRFVTLLKQFEAAKSQLKLRDQAIADLQTAAKARDELINGLQMRLDVLERQGKRVGDGQ